MYKIPLCFNCKNNCNIKAEIMNDNNQIGIIENIAYCEYFKRIVNYDNYLDKCEGYVKGNTKSKEIELNEFKNIKKENDNEENILSNREA